MTSNDTPTPGTTKTITVVLGRSIEVTDEMIAGALEAANGILTEAAVLVGWGKSTTYIFDRVNRSPWLTGIMLELRGRRVDRAERGLDNAIAREEPWAISLVLKTLGKDRGYTERSEVTGKDGSPLHGNDFIMVVEHGKSQIINATSAEVIDSVPALDESTDDSHPEDGSQVSSTDNV